MATLLLVAAIAVAQETEDAREYREYCEKWQVEYLVAAKEELETLRRTYRANRRRLSPGKARAMSARMQFLPKVIAALEAGKQVQPTISIDSPPKAGQMGMVRIPPRNNDLEWCMRVFQIPSPGEMLVQCHHSPPGGNEWESGQLLWLTKVDTNGLTSDSQFVPTGCFKVEGTKTYRSTAGGTRTVFLLRQLDLGKAPKRKPASSLK